MTGCTSMASNSEDLKVFILSLEEQALKLWNRGNPDGFIELSSDDVVYIDPAFKNKLEGKKALEEYYNSIRGKVEIDRYKMIEPTVLLSSDVAVLAYDYEAYRDDRTFRMHCTEVYKQDSSEQWKIYIPIGLFVLPDNGGQNGNGRIFSLQEDAGILSTILSHLYLNHAFFTTVCLCIFVILLSDI